MDFREVLIDIYCPKKVEIEAIPASDGYELLIKATKNFAL